MPSGNQSRGKRRQSSRRHASVPRGMGQLDIVPAEADLQPQQEDSHQNAPLVDATKQRPQRVPTPHPSQDYENVSDEELLELMSDNICPDEDGEGGNVSRQSSPAASRAADDLMKGSAEYFEEDYELPATSSPRNENLPDTLPLPEPERIDSDTVSDTGKHSAIDLSETATTARRSPSLRPSEAQGLRWMDPSSRATSNRLTKDNDRSSAVGEELPAAIFSNARVARVKKAPDVDEGEQSHEKQLDPEQPREDNEAALNTYRDSGALPEKTNSGITKTSPTVIIDQNVQSPAVDNKRFSRKPLEDITQGSASKAVQPKSSRSPVKQSIQGPSPTPANTSGKKRKQRAKDPIVFDAVTQEVREGPALKKRSPPAPQSADKAVKKAAPASKTPAAVAKKTLPVSESPTISKKRPASKAARKPAKKAKTEMKQAPHLTSPKRTSHRAAAQAAQAAVRQQLDSSPYSEAKAVDTSDLESQRRHPAIDHAAKPSSPGAAAIREHIDPSPCSEPQTRDATEPENHRRQHVIEQVAKPPMPAKGTVTLKPSSRKGFGGASGRMYTARSKFQTIGDSQNDTQDLIRAHLAEEQATDNHVLISSDSSSVSDDAEPPAPPPKPVQDVREHGQRTNKPGQMQIRAVDGVIPTRAETSGRQGMVGNAILAAADHKNAGKQRGHRSPNTEYGQSSKTGHTPSQTHTSVTNAREHAAEPKSNSNSARRRSQANWHPDDAFVDNQTLDDRGRARIKSAWNRTLSISQQGSPTRLGDGEDGLYNAERQAHVDEASASSAVMKEYLENGSQRPPHPVRHVRRRLSYHTISCEAKQPGLMTDAPRSELTGETLVDSGGSKAQASKPSASRIEIRHADALKIKNKIYDQILIADRVEEPRHKNLGPEAAPKKASPMGTRREHVHDQLQSIIITITQRLFESEQGPGDTVETYEEGTSNCVQKYHHRLDTEHGDLLDEWTSHSQAFNHSVDKAKRPLRDAATTRRDGAHGVEETLSKRQQLYDQAVSSLRAFHNQVMRA